MSVTSVQKDPENLTLTLIADFDAPIERVWDLWADPRKLERWWGPPGYPATFENDDLSPGGEVPYYMTGPEGDRHRGWWGITALDPPRSLTFDMGFANEDGTRNDDMPPASAEVTLTEREHGTRMQMRSTFPSREAMDKVIEMGMEEGLRQAVGQMDALISG